MKKATCLLVLFGFCCCLFAQQPVQAIAAPDEYYLKKSKNQKTAAITLLSGGGLLTVLAFVIPPSKREVEGLFINEEVYTVRYIALFTGLGAMAGSIPLFIASGKNRKRAFGIAANIKLETATSLRQSGWTKINYPAVSIKINL